MSQILLWMTPASIFTALTGLGQGKWEQWAPETIPGCSGFGDVTHFGCLHVWFLCFLFSFFFFLKTSTVKELVISSHNYFYRLKILDILQNYSNSSFAWWGKPHTGMLIWAVCRNLVRRHGRARSWSQCRSPGWRWAPLCSPGVVFLVALPSQRTCCWFILWIQIHGTNLAPVGGLQKHNGV